MIFVESPGRSPPAASPSWVAVQKGQEFQHEQKDAPVECIQALETVVASKRAAQRAQKPFPARLQEATARVSCSSQECRNSSDQGYAGRGLCQGGTPTAQCRGWCGSQQHRRRFTWTDFAESEGHLGGVTLSGHGARRRQAAGARSLDHRRQARHHAAGR